jgi:haloalkane dehalogenase
VEYEEPSIHEGGSRIYTRDYLGGGNPIVLMHGFPDNLHLYDRLVPHVAAVRRVVTFDFLGWGASDKPPSLRPTARSQVGDLDCVVNQLGLERVTLVAHDASGPPASDWALLHPDRVELLVLLNTYYHWFLGLRRPAAIALYSTPVVRNVGRTIATRYEGLDRRLYFWQVGRFIRDADTRAEVVPPSTPPSGRRGQRSGR